MNDIGVQRIDCVYALAQGGIVSTERNAQGLVEDAQEGWNDAKRVAQVSVVLRYRHSFNSIIISISFRVQTTLHACFV